MHRVDDSKFLLYLEFPKELKNEYPIQDEITEIMQQALDEAVEGTANYSNLDEKEQHNTNYAYKGFHSTDCGKHSTNVDYLLKNGMITNSLCVYYLKYYRDSIPLSEMKKVIELVKYYKENG